MKARTYVGRPCKRGHDGKRYASTRECVLCSRARTLKHQRGPVYLARVEEIALSLDPAALQALLTRPCQYCGHAADPLNVIDLSIPTRGYVAGNVGTACHSCFKAKGNRSRMAFLFWVATVYRNIKGELPKIALRES